MQLLSMDVIRNGLNDRFQIGPLSSGLNVICGPKGSGKTALLHWLRHIASEAFPNQRGGGDLHAPFHGSVEIRNQRADYKVTQHTDGSIRRYDSQLLKAHFSSAKTPWMPVEQGDLSKEQKQTFTELHGVGHTPEAIKELEDLVRRLSILVPIDDAVQRERRELTARFNDITERLRTLKGLRSSRESLLARRGDLEAELHRAQHRVDRRHSVSSVGRERLETQRAGLVAELRRIEEELRTVETQTPDHEQSFYSARRSKIAGEFSGNYSESMHRLECQLENWRLIQRDLQGYRQWLQVAGNDYGTTNDVVHYAAGEPDYDVRLQDAHRQLTVLIERCDHSSQDCPPALAATLRQMQREIQDFGQPLARYDQFGLAELLRQHASELGRCESEILRAIEQLMDERAGIVGKIPQEHLSTDQARKAHRSWAPEQDRYYLRQRILRDEPLFWDPDAELEADAVYADNRAGATDGYSSESYFSKYSQHPVWSQTDRYHRLTQLQQHAMDLRLRLRDIELQLSLARRAPIATVAGRPEPAVLHDLDLVTTNLQELEERDRLRVELADIRKRLAHLPMSTHEVDRFHKLVNLHISNLLGNQLRSLASDNAFSEGNFDDRYFSDRHYLHSNFGSSVGNSEPRYRESVRPVHYSYRSGVVNGYDDRRWHGARIPHEIRELALRLAIGQLSAERGQPITLMIDLLIDQLKPAQQQAVIKHLAAIAQRGQQIILFSSDERVAEMVRAVKGWAGYMRDWNVAQVSYVATNWDVNRQLQAYANEHELQKWHYPPIPERSSQGERVARRPVARRDTLTEQSLIEDCPCFEATTAARCRALGVDRVGDLLTTDPHWLAQHLRVNTVTSSTVMRWQAEARLLCTVRQLRHFDARVLVGSGIHHPKQLAEMHPSQLLERVERFLSTDRGREILRSGNSYELSRITSWIASASGDSHRRSTPAYNEERLNASFADAGPFYEDQSYEYSQSSRAVTDRTRDREYRDYQQDRDRGRDGNGRANAPRNVSRSRESNASREFERQSSASVRTPKPYDYTSNSNGAGANGAGTNGAGANGAGANTGSSSSSGFSLANSAFRQPSGQDRTERNRSTRRTTSTPRVAYEKGGRSRDDRADSVRVHNSGESAGNGLRFYLDLSSPVVDAPSIGPRIAEKLEAIGIHTVADLLRGNAQAIAEQLDTRRIEAATVLAWQQQAQLVCRIPNLRGHDAQLLVLAGVTAAEQVSGANAATLLASVTKHAQGVEGQRILRGSKEPDLAEVNDWISWASNSRSLNAA